MSGAASLFGFGLLAAMNCLGESGIEMPHSTSQAPALDLSAFGPWKPGLPDGNYQMSPPYSDAPELTPRAEVPKGAVFHFTMDSTDSLRYPGISKTEPLKIVPYKRNVTVYVPHQYVPGTQADLIVSQDSMGRNELPTILDNMIPDHRLPVIVAVMLDSGGSDAQGSERGLEYDTMSGGYADFIEYEVLPRVTKETGVTFTKDPKKRMTMGGSSGGACALSMAWYRPNFYHKVLTYSGTYVNQQWPPDPETPHGAWEYHEHLIPESKRKPLRIWMEVGENDIRSKDPESTYHNWPLANVRMAKVLKEKGYPYQFVFAHDAGHVDWRVVKQTLPAALEWVWNR